MIPPMLPAAGLGLVGLILWPGSMQGSRPRAGRFGQESLFPAVPKALSKMTFRKAA